MRCHAQTLSHPALKVNRLCRIGQRAYGAAMEPRPDQDKQRTALADLERLRHERDALSGLFGRAGAHFAAADTPAGDRIELWGQRIGRGLSAVAFLCLAFYLYVTYVH